MGWKINRFNYLIKTGPVLGSRATASQVRPYSAGDKKGIPTPLHDLHVKYGGKLVPFAGYLLPVQYADQSVSASHLHTRRAASVFDVSHMLQTTVRGRDCVPWFESLCTADLAGAAAGAAALTVFLNERGGIIDDLIVTKVSDRELYVVSNAGRADVDKAHMLERLGPARRRGRDVAVEFRDPREHALLAVQGPAAAAALQPLTDVPLAALPFMASRCGSVAGAAARVTRCGYTGEDGVEVAVAAADAARVTEALLAAGVRLAGLGARDSLRLEAGLCLYGSDIDEGVTPVEAALAWVVARRRRAAADFPGAAAVLQQLSAGAARRRVGLRGEGAPARAGAALRDRHGRVVGRVTSGCPSPSLGGNVAMGYVEDAYKKIGTELTVDVRNKAVPYVVAKMPFVPSNYYVVKK